jgi:hypothetical protein
VGSGGALDCRGAFKLIEPVDHLGQRLVDRLGFRCALGGAVLGHRSEAFEVLAQRPDEIGIDPAAVERNG